MVTDELGKVDKGFELIYWKLSYRRKFIRTLWMSPLIIILAIVAWWSSHSILFTSIAVIFSLVVLIVQATYNYTKWKGYIGFFEKTN